MSLLFIYNRIYLFRPVMKSLTLKNKDSSESSVDKLYRVVDKLREE